MLDAATAGATRAGSIPSLRKIKFAPRIKLFEVTLDFGYYFGQIARPVERLLRFIASTCIIVNNSSGWREMCHSFIDMRHRFAALMKAAIPSGIAVRPCCLGTMRGASSFTSQLSVAMVCLSHKSKIVYT